MKTKKIIESLILLTIGVFIFNCQSAQTKVTAPKKTEPLAQNENLKSEAPEVSAEVNIDSLNKQLEEVKITGFRKNQTKLADTPVWLGQSLPVFQTVVSEIPDGYVLQVMGHCDKSGTQALNQKVSTERAKYIYGLLIDKGLSQNKVEYKGFAAEKTIDKIDPFDARNRRVSFQIIKE